MRPAAYQTGADSIPEDYYVMLVLMLSSIESTMLF
jgi:hypothetical protein